MKRFCVGTAVEMCPSTSLSGAAVLSDSVGVSPITMVSYGAATLFVSAISTTATDN